VIVEEGVPGAGILLDVVLDPIGGQCDDRGRNDRGEPSG
jgi:hypothetical protein